MRTAGVNCATPSAAAQPVFTLRTRNVRLAPALPNGYADAGWENPGMVWESAVSARPYVGRAERKGSTMPVRTLATWGLALAAMATVAAPARAELELSLEISGSVDEVLAALQHLQAAGFGQPSATGTEGLKLEVHSTATSGDAAAPEAAPPAEAAPPTPEPPLAMRNIQMAPTAVAAGEVLRVSVDVRDEAKLIDTVAANLHTAEKEFTFDLFDNGSHGDIAAGDGVWSVNVAVPGAATPGDYTLTLYAYDAAGTRLTLPNDAGEAVPVPVSVEAALTVKP